MKKTVLILAAASVFLSSMIWASGAFAQRTFGLSAAKKVTSAQIELMTSHGIKADQINDFKKLVSSAPGKVKVNIDKTVKVPDFVKAGLSFPPEITKPEEQGYYYFEQYKGLYRIKDVRKELRHVRTKKNRFGNDNVLYQQYYRGVKVIGADMIVHLKKGNRLWFIQGRLVPDIDISTVPSVQSTSVTQTVSGDFRNRRGTGLQFSVSSPELGILNRWIYNRSLERENVLIWVVPVTEVATGRIWTYYVDSLTGKVLYVNDSLKGDGSIDSEIYDQNNGATLELWYVDNVLLPWGPTPDQDVTDLNTFTTEYWSYLHTTFGVHSTDSSLEPPGMLMSGYAYHCDNPDGNDCGGAHYGGSIAAFPEGTVNRDTVGHEWTHGLVAHSPVNGDVFSSVNYQSAGLSESFPDVFAQFYDCWAGGECDWISNRVLMNPLAKSRFPDYVGDTEDPFTYHPYWYPGIGNYRSSGVPSLVAYLLVYGTLPDAPHYNYHIKGLGLSKTEQLYFRTLVDAGLPSSADFEDVGNTMVEVCDDLVWNPPSGVSFTANDCYQIVHAWLSVGINVNLFNASTLSGDVYGNLASIRSPWFVTDDITIPSGSTLTVEPGVDVYFFPNTKIKANGLLDVDGTSGTIRFISSVDSNGKSFDRQFKLMDGGELKMPVNTYWNTDLRRRVKKLREIGDNGGVDPTGDQDGEMSSFIRIDEGFTVADVNVTLTITHANVSDLRVILESPDNTQVVLFNGIGGNGDNYTNTTLNDEATNPITAGSAPFTGSFQPQNALSAFDGKIVRGYWRLRVKDTVNNNVKGTLDSWAITFNQ